MELNLSKVYSLFFICLLFSSFYFYNISDLSTKEIEPEKKRIANQNNSCFDDVDKIDQDSNLDSNNIIRKTENPGTYKSRAFFAHDTVMDIFEDKQVYEMEPYEDIIDEGTPFSADIEYAIHDSYSRSLPPQANIFYPFKDIYAPWWEIDERNSTLYSPIFTEDTYIDGKAFFHIQRELYIEGSRPTITFRLRLLDFDPTDNSTTILVSEEQTEPGYNYHYYDKIWHISHTFSAPYLIEKGHRLIIKYEAKFSHLSFSYIEYYLCSPFNWNGHTETWTINDPNPDYSNTYSFEDTLFMLGAQFYLFGTEYPIINVSGFQNNTVYINENKNITIGVTDSVNSSFRWNEGNYEYFNTSTWTMSPETHGWHTLEVKAKDVYDNEKISYYLIGYDESSLNIILTNQVNGSLIGDSSTLEFSVFNISYATGEWDKSGSIEYLNETGYTTIAPSDAGYHNLTVNTYDEFGVCQFFYFFTIDNSPPIISLYNVINNTEYPAGKAIDVNITDQSSSLEIFYKWDNRDNLSWSPFSGTIYRTYLPESEGEHWLHIYATDSFGHSNYVAYNFTTNIYELLVELFDMLNNSYYYGGNNVNITITGSNNTVYYKWNEELENSIILTNPFLFLTGDDALPSDLGVHFLTIRTFNELEVESIFVFKFIIDQEAPVIDSSISNYNNTAFLPSTIFTFILSDNYTQNSELIVKFSINGGSNQTLSTPFELSLSILSDNDYTLILYVFDIANNYATATIFFSIDTVYPELDISIEGLAIVLLDGSKYIPANATVTVEVDDADPNTTITYSWGGTIYNSFTDNFTLDYPDGTAILYINATDTVGHSTVETIELTIDSTPPTLLFPANYSVINKEANLIFIIEDISVNTIKEVRYAWDIFIPFTIALLPDASGEVSIKLFYLYNERIDPAIIFFNVTDIVGNTRSYQFSFIIDLTPPLPALYISDSETGENRSISTDDFIRGDSCIWYNSSENDDLRDFRYYWDGKIEDIEQLTNPWELQDIPVLDGLHNLTIILRDNTTNGDYPNTLQITYNLTVDNIKIDFIEPVDFENNYHHQMEYQDSFVFILNISNVMDNSSIDSLAYSIVKDLSINLDVSIFILNNITYEITITATNVTNGEYTEIECHFWQFENHKEIIKIYLLIDKKEGNLVIINSSQRIIYGEDIVVTLKLNDDLNLTAQEIKIIQIEGITVSNFQIIDIEELVFQACFSTSLYFNSKGNYSLEIYASSDFFFDSLTSSGFMEIEILPIPVVLFVNVSSYEIIEGTQLALYAILTYENGTPIPLETLYFYIYIVYKNETTGVQAFILNYDEMQSLTGITNSTGQVILPFEMKEDYEYVSIDVEYKGSLILGEIKYELEDFVYTIPAPGLPLPTLIAIIVGSVILIIIVSIIIYTITKPKPFEKLMQGITDEEISLKYSLYSPGIVLSIFDQHKGPIPLLSNHSLELPVYKTRMPIAIENFLLKISDQAYSSLGFEEHGEERRTGTIRLSKEKMVGFIHGISLKNPQARGGIENLTLTILTDIENTDLLLNNQEFLYSEIDKLIKALDQKKHISEIREILTEIRKLSVVIMLASQKIEETKK